MGKGEIAHNEQFLLFSQFFSSFLVNFLPFSSNLEVSSANSPSFGRVQNFSVGKVKYGSCDEIGLLKKFEPSFENGENVVTSISSFFHQCFLESSSTSLLKLGIDWCRVEVCP